jgi:hypothetical protein
MQKARENEIQSRELIKSLGDVLQELDVFFTKIDDSIEDRVDGLIKCVSFSCMIASSTHEFLPVISTEHWT